jgi:hypothetical protein
MAHHEDREVSRRKLLGGLGTFAGASLLVGARKGAAASPAGETGAEGLPTFAPAGYVQPEGVIAPVAPAVNPAWTYLTVGYRSFFSQTPITTTVDVNGLHAATEGFFTAALDLPQGAILREATFHVYNASPSTGLSVGVGVLTPPSASMGGSFGFTSPNALVHTVTLTSFPFVNPIDNTLSGYLLSSFLTGGATFGLLGARLAWEKGLFFTAVNPQVRKLDTRSPGPFTGKLAGGVTIAPISLLPELPSGAKAAVLNVTVTQTEGAGFLGLFPDGTAWPHTSSINWSGPGQTVANGTTVSVSPAGALSIICGGTADAKAHVVVDLLGYYL